MLLLLLLLLLERISPLVTLTKCRSICYAKLQEELNSLHFNV